MTKSKEWMVDIGYPIKGMIGYNDVVDEALDDELGETASSGSGFGYRDKQWNFPTKKEAEKAAVIAKKILKKKGFKVGDWKNKQAYVWVCEA